MTDAKLEQACREVVSILDAKALLWIEDGEEGASEEQLRRTARVLLAHLCPLWEAQKKRERQLKEALAELSLLYDDRRKYDVAQRAPSLSLAISTVLRAYESLRDPK